MMLFVNRVANKIAQDSRVIGLGHFGSSLTTDQFNDIDIIILVKEGQCRNSNVYSKIDQLRCNYKSCVHQEISTHDNDLHSMLVELDEVKMGKYEIKFVFGPVFKTGTSKYIHIKGPLSVNEMNYFLRLFPIHGCSILDNCQWIYAQNDFYFERPKVTMKEYKLNVQILRNRLLDHLLIPDKSMKIINKLRLMNKVIEKELNVNSNKINVANCANLIELFDELTIRM
jgi:hypothetical protein